MYRLPYRNFGGHESRVVNHTVAGVPLPEVPWYEILSLRAALLLLFRPARGVYVCDKRDCVIRGSLQTCSSRVSNDAKKGASRGGRLRPTICSYTESCPCQDHNNAKADNAISHYARTGDQGSVGRGPRHRTGCFLNYLAADQGRASGTPRRS